MFERRTAVETDTRDASNRELDDQHITGLAGWVVTGRTVYAAHYAVGKPLDVEAAAAPQRPYRTRGKSYSLPLQVLSI